MVFLYRKQIPPYHATFVVVFVMGHLAAAEQAKQDRPVRLKASIIIGYKHVR